MMSPGFRRAGTRQHAAGTRAAKQLNGNNWFTYGDIFQRTSREDVQRILGSAQASWRPFAWLQNDGDGRRRSRRPLRRRRSAASANARTRARWRLGRCPIAHRLDRNFSVKLTSNAAWQATRWLNLKTTAGADYTNHENDGDERERHAASAGRPVGWFRPRSRRAAARLADGDKDAGLLPAGAGRASATACS